MKNGYVKLEGVFSRDAAAEKTRNLWVRLGMDPNDKSTWTKEWINMPAMEYWRVEDFAPRAWAAIGDLVGGHDRLADEERFRSWNDAWIVNLGKAEYDDGTSVPNPQDLVGYNNQVLRNDVVGWHCDGDWFLHFLDSGEQALLVVPIYSDIKPGGGGTYIAPQSIGMVAKWLEAHPEGVEPSGFDFAAMRDQCTEFVELTGNAGDCILMHPFMLHAASPNRLRIPRVITNPSASLREPYRLKRERVEDFCLVELKTLEALGIDPAVGSDFSINGQRRRLVPERQLRQDAERVKEQARLAAMQERKQ